MTGTATILAVASTMLMPMGRIIDSRGVPPLAAAWFFIIISSGSVGILFVWEAIPNGFQADLATTTLLQWGWFCIAFPGLMMCGGVRFRAAGLAIIGGASAAALGWSAQIWNMNSTIWNARGVVLSLVGYAIASTLLGDPVGEATRTSRRSVRWATRLLAVLGAVAWFIILPAGVRVTPDLVAMCTGVTTIVAILSGALLIDHARGPKWARIVHQWTLVCMGLAGAGVSYEGWINRFQWNGEMGTIVAALIVLAVSGLLVTLVLDRFERSSQVKRRSLDDVTVVRIECPSCGIRQSVLPGSSECGRCRLGILVGLELRYCPTCQYELRGTPLNASCPECGTSLGPRTLPIESEQ